jgi:23S rRNA pseudouridine2605 synthase
MAVERVQRALARAGFGSRRACEELIVAGRVEVNGKVATLGDRVDPELDAVRVDGRRISVDPGLRYLALHKPRGVTTTMRDAHAERDLRRFLPRGPRVFPVGRLDRDTEGLLLLTNDGGLARTLELPATGWTRRYRVRVYGRVDPEKLAGLGRGITLDAIRYGPIEARIDSEKGGNLWLTVALAEGKNREVKIVLEHLGLTVNRLIRVAFGPFQLGDLARGGVEEIPRRVLRDQLGTRLGGSLAKGRDADRRR